MENFSDAFTWIAILLTVILGVFKIICMNQAFHFFSQTEVTPTYMSMAMIFNILFGAVCLDEIDEMSNK